MFLRASLFSLGVFVALGVISLIVAAIMKLVYSAVQKGGKKSGNSNDIQQPAAPKKAGQA